MGFAAEEQSGLLALGLVATRARPATGPPWQAPVKAFSNKGFDHGLAADV